MGAAFVVVGDLAARSPDGAGVDVASSLSQPESGAPLLVLGASGPVGRYLLDRLSDQGVTVMAVSRHQPRHASTGVIWLQQDLSHGPAEVDASVLVSLGPIRHALAQVESGRHLGRVVALSSASTLFKSNSPDAFERELMAELITIEKMLSHGCQVRKIELTLLKPTMIYGGRRGSNVERIGGLIDRLSVVPYCGRGLRQPVHADDIAGLIVNCLKQGSRASGCFQIGGGETLEYPNMLRRVASARGRTVQLLRLPTWLMKPVLRLATLASRLEDIKPAMLERQSMDLIVDDQPARERLGWRPRPFRP